MRFSISQDGAELCATRKYLLADDEVFLVLLGTDGTEIVFTNQVLAYLRKRQDGTSVDDTVSICGMRMEVPLSDEGHHDIKFSIEPKVCWLFVEIRMKDELEALKYFKALSALILEIRRKESKSVAHETLIW